MIIIIIIIIIIIKYFLLNLFIVRYFDVEKGVEIFFTA